MGLMNRILPAASDDEVIDAVRAALGEARRLGVTSVQDMDGSDAAMRAQALSPLSATGPPR